MKPIFTWPLNLQTFGGGEMLCRKALESEPHRLTGQFIQIQAGRGAVLKVRFVRQGIVSRLEFRGPNKNQFRLVTATAVTTAQNQSYFAIRLDVIANSLRVGLAFNQRTGLSMRCGPSGRAGGMVLPFVPDEMRRVSRATVTSCSLDTRILGSWSVLTVVALSRCGDAALVEILAHQKSLKQGSYGLLRDTSRKYRLRTGGGFTGIFLPSGRLDRVDA